MRLIFLSLSLAICGCAADGSARIDTRIPIGENAKYGTILLGIGYLPPEEFANVLNQPTIGDK